MEYKYEGSQTKMKPSFLTKQKDSIFLSPKSAKFSYTTM